MSFRPPGAILTLVVTLALVPSPMSASSPGQASATELARTYVSKNAAELGVTSADVTDLVVTSSYRSSHSGVTHVNLNQRHQDLEVFGGHVSVSIADNGTVVFAGGSLARQGAGAVHPVDAVAVADPVVVSPRDRTR